MAEGEELKICVGFCRPGGQTLTLASFLLFVQEETRRVCQADLEEPAFCRPEMSKELREFQ